MGRTPAYNAAKMAKRAAEPMDDDHVAAWSKVGETSAGAGLPD